ncbi:Dyp-type peroxidase [Aquirhabdus sp.]|uniref:Dyp-type peroxidase n=1 Tax=Aquirhabdus sp. TaxID=2824160 RepID=UPI00396CFA75
MSPQSGILPPIPGYARFLILNIEQLGLDQLKAQLTKFEETRNRLLTQYPNSRLSTSIGFGAELWQRLGLGMPRGFHALQPLIGKGTSDKFAMPATGGDLLFHIHSDRADLCFILAQVFMQGISNQVQVLDERNAFSYLDHRDLTGFIDGTENPQGSDDRAEATLLGEGHGKFAGGSFAFSQRFVHDLATWNRLKVDAQEHVFGRSKLESIEQPEGIKRTNSHIGRVVIEDAQGEELEIVRHSMPYGDASGDQGLFFQAYTKDLTVIDRMLSRMYGIEDGIGDRMLNFVTPVSGAYFFVPSQNMLDDLIDA